MYFLNEDHAYNFQNMILKDRTHPSDLERMSLFYIIGGNEDLFTKFRQIYDFKNHEINLEILTNGQVDLCSSSKALVRLAYNLFNGYEDEHTTPKDLFCNLDRKNYLVAKGGIDRCDLMGILKNKKQGNWMKRWRLSLYEIIQVYRN